ncbi:MAG TPA: MFS transporter [Burkholderiales bacterium]|nr:MFS transporter [Burkholderiales bacterium]
MSTGSSSNRGFALYLGVVQFFFATTWTIYVLYLPQLAAQAGIDERWVPWILVADQAVFAVMDVVTGFWIDRVRAGLARFGGWILGITVVSSLAFVFLPFVGSTLMLLCLAVWAVTSSALRSPPWALLGRYAATPALPWLSALVLTGNALAAAAAPYLGIALRGVSPTLPFLLSTLTLVATVAGLVYIERRSVRSETVGEISKEDPWRIGLFFAALLLLAVGFQVHFSLNSAPQYLRFAAATDLPWLMPVFWIGFNVLMFPAAGLVERLGASRTMALAGAVGALAALAAALAASLPALVAAHFVAGGAWGAASVAAYSAAIAFGRTGREGRFLGTLFAMLAIAAFARIAAVASGFALDPAVRTLLPWLPQTAWLLAALLLVFALRPARAFRQA